MLPIVFITVEHFSKGACLQQSVDLYSKLLFGFSFVGIQSVSMNLWIVDLCSVDLRSWNWKGVGEAMNFIDILHGGLNFIIQVSLWAHITSLGGRR